MAATSSSRSPNSSATLMRDVRDAADRALVVGVRGRSRWSSAILPASCTTVLIGESRARAGAGEENELGRLVPGYLPDAEASDCVTALQSPDAGARHARARAGPLLRLTSLSPL
nr:transcription factor bHLH149-like [Lolium perenne]